MRRRYSVLALVLALTIVAGAAPVHAETVTFSFHDGEGEGVFQSLVEGDAEAIRFEVAHPALLDRIRLWTLGTGNVEVHVWADNGGLQPDLTRDLTPPQIVSATSEEPVEVVFPANTRIDPPQPFYVGIVRGADAQGLWFDAHEPYESRSVLYTYIEDYGKKLWVGGLEGNFMVEADVTYVDVLEERWFTDVTEDTGVALSGRISWADYDGDGDPDLCVRGSTLYRNEGAGAFLDVTEAAGIGGSGSNGGLWADYDNDGDLDLYATVSSFQSEDPTRHDHLWRNNGDGTFTDVSDEAGAPYDDFPTEAAGWGDFDGDGFVDLYVANYEQPGETLSIGTPDFLWRNNGDGTFSDASEAAGIRAEANQCGRGVAWADFDQDGDQDIYVSNYRLDPNFLWVNQGDGTFLEEAEARGVQGVPQRSGWQTYWGHTIGSAWGDMDGDGVLDLVTANLAHPRFIEFSDKTMLYRNGGGPDWTFTDRFGGSGVAYSETHSNPALGDVDNDGDLDLHITCVYAERSSYFYTNEGGWDFADAGYPAGLAVWNGWGSGFADFDGDGDLDFAANRLFRNDGDARTPAGHWLKTRLEGTVSNRAAIGARVVVFAGGRVFVRQVAAGTGTGCQEPLTLHFGLGEHATVERVIVRWPTGLSETREGPFPADQELRLVEGDVPLPPPVVEPTADVGTPAPDAGSATPDVPAVDAGTAAPPDTPSAPETAAPLPDTGAAGDDGGDGGGCTVGSKAPASAALLLLLALATLRRRGRRVAAAETR